MRLRDAVYYGYVATVGCGLVYLVAFPDSAANFLDPTFAWALDVARSLARAMPAWVP